MAKLKIEKIIAPLSLTSPVTSSRFFVLGFLASILLSIIRFIAIPYVRIAEIAIIKTIKSNILNPILCKIIKRCSKCVNKTNYLNNSSRNMKLLNFTAIYYSKLIFLSGFFSKFFDY